MSVIRLAYAWVILTGSLSMLGSGAWLWWSGSHERHVLLLGVLGVLFLSTLVTVLGLILLIRWARTPVADFQSQVQALSDRRFIELQQPKVEEWVTLSKALNVMVARVRMMLAEQDEALQRLNQKVSQDALTQLASRQHLMEKAQKAMLHEGPGGAFAILRLQDLDGLNKRLGRQRADDLLVAVATAMNARLLLDDRARDTTTLARLNGSEFGLLMPGFQRDAVEKLLQAMSHALSQLGEDGLADTHAVVRIGASLFRAGESTSDVMLRADTAVNLAEFDQQALVITEPTALHHTIAVAQWRVILETALDNGHLHPVFFPVINDQGRVLHDEAYLRLTEPHGETLEAATFMPPALRSGRTMELDLRAIQLCLVDIQRNPRPVAVNAALQSALHPMFGKRLEALLRTHAEAARHLSLELREPDVALRVLPALNGLATLLHAHGAKMGIDNVGLTQHIRPLMEMPDVDYLKLSSALCKKVLGNAAAQAQIELLVAWAERRHMSLVACGADNEALLTKLKQLGLRYFSGKEATRQARPHQEAITA